MTDIAAPSPEANPPPQPRRHLASFLASDNLLARVASAERGFNIIVTSQPRGSILTHLWGTSYLVFMDSL